MTTIKLLHLMNLKKKMLPNNEILLTGVLRTKLLVILFLLVLS